jgi:hypothetical protein
MKIPITIALAALVVALGLLFLFNYTDGNLFNIWLADNPGVIHSGNPDRIVFASFPADSFPLGTGEDIIIYGSSYASGSEADCNRIGGTIKTSGAWVGRCLLNDARANIEYITDGVGNRYDSFRYSATEYLVLQENHGYIPTSMTWHMKTSVYVPPPPDEPTCSDGIQNQDETGVDCGGVCDTCEGGQDGQDLMAYLLIGLSVAAIIGLALYWRSL